MYSIYHFFKSLVEKKSYFFKAKKLDGFPFDERLLSCRNEGIFPDMAIRLNKDKSIFMGGELIELKDAEGNILNPKKYPEIKDDTLNLVVLPCHNDGEQAELIRKLQLAFGGSLNAFNIFKIKHHFNGYFLVFQTGLR
jgi:hypothetical protein